MGKKINKGLVLPKTGEEMEKTEMQNVDGGMSVAGGIITGMAVGGMAAGVAIAAIKAFSGGRGSSSSPTATSGDTSPAYPGGDYPGGDYGGSSPAAPGSPSVETGSPSNPSSGHGYFNTNSHTGGSGFGIF
ncbi:MAG: hypothetical protein FWB72_00535 [Firmicutes bacterium]|nr:hypothetical protein [Bacillota bacterium]